MDARQRLFSGSIFMILSLCPPLPHLTAAFFHPSSVLTLPERAAGMSLALAPSHAPTTNDKSSTSSYPARDTPTQPHSNVGHMAHANSQPVGHSSLHALHHSARADSGGQWRHLHR